MAAILLKLKDWLAPHVWAFKLAVVVAAFIAGCTVTNWRWEAKEAEALEAQVKAATKARDRMDMAAVDALAKEAKSHNAEAKQLETWRHDRAKSPADCPLAPATLRLLQADPVGAD